MADEMSPQKDTEKMTPLSLRVPESVNALIKEISEEDNIDKSMIYRDLIAIGLPQYLERRSKLLEYRNKQLVQQKLQRRTDDLEQALKILNEPFCSPEEQERAAELIRRAIN